MIKTKKPYIITVILLVIISAALLFTLPVSADPTAGSATLQVSVSDDGSSLDFSVSVAKNITSYDGFFHIFELQPNMEQSDIAGLTPLKSFDFSKRTLTFSEKLEDNSVRLFYKYTIAVKDDNGIFVPISNVAYVANVDIVADSTFDYPKATSKKGLSIQLVADAQELGVSNTVLNISVNDYLLPEKTENSVTFNFDNNFYYIDKNMLDRLDFRVRTLSESGINIYLNFILTDTDIEKLGELTYIYRDPDANTSIYAFNTSREEAMRCLGGFFSFIADRYTSPDRLNGFAGSFIVGYEVNSSLMSSGFESAEAAVAYYAKLLRLADTALRSNYSNGRVYVSLSNRFNYTSGENYSETGFVPTSEFLRLLSEEIKSEGDIPWNVAINPYPYDLKLSSIWEDENSTDSFDTLFISVKNLHTFCRFFSQNEFLYGSEEKRRVLISELGISGEAGTEKETLQAASFVYAYKTVESLDVVDALIYHRQVDHSGEQGIYYGLWSASPTALLEPYNKKYIYDVFKYIDTQRVTDSLTPSVDDFALDVIGISSWNEIIPEYEDKSYGKIIYENISEGSTAENDSLKKNMLFDFSRNSFYSFYPTENTEFIEIIDDAELDKKVLISKMYYYVPNEYMGIGTVGGKALDISSSRFISLKLKIDAPVSDEDFNVKLRMSGTAGEKHVTYEGIVQAKSGKWCEVSFPVEEFASTNPTVTSMKIWIKSASGHVYNGNLYMSLADISALEEYETSIFGVIFSALLIISGVIIVLIVLRVIYMVRKAKKYKKMQERRAAIRRIGPSASQPAPSNGRQQGKPQQNTVLRGPDPAKKARASSKPQASANRNGQNRPQSRDNQQNNQNNRNRNS